MGIDSDFLFVYGTLGPSFSNPYAAFLRQHSQYLGAGWISGLLVDLGTYPGATYDSDAMTLVHGFIYNISTRKTDLLKTLDDYEGVGPDCPEPQEYIRSIIPVNTNGLLTPCWTYLYKLDIRSQPIIDSGDYVLFLNTP